MESIPLEKRSLLLSPSVVVNAVGKSTTFFGRYWKELKDRSLNIPSILLLIYFGPIAVCTVIVYSIGSDIIVPPNSCNFSDPESYPVAYNAMTLVENFLYFIIPFCGWLSDTKFGRGRAIYFSLLIGWIGALLQAISCCLQYSSCGTISLIGRYAFSGIALLFLVVSMAFMYANILACAMEQMINMSSVKIRAFIHWYVWIYFLCGNGTSYTTFLTAKKYENGVLIISLIAFTLFSVSLCLHFHLKQHFEDIPIPNPYHVVFQVLKFSLNSKLKRQWRSAFTYWQREPSRIDFAKERYGGSFTHEEVENVKTFLRILAILASLSPFLIASDPFINGISSFVPQYKDGNDALKGNASFVIWFIGDNIVLVLVPLFELVILPLFPKLEYFLMNPLRGLGLANICLLLSILSIFLIDLIGRVSETANHILCFTSTKIGSTFDLSYWILLLPSILAGISDALVFICIFEFLCSQAPFGMHGMLIGLFWFFHYFFADISAGVTMIFQYHTISPESTLSCTSWFTIILGSVALLGFVLFILTSRWYVKRVRDLDLGLRTAIEEQYEKRLVNEESFSNEKQPEYDEYVIISSDDEQ